MRYLLTIEYLGKNYSGWQRQKNALSIQEVIEESFSIFFNEKIVIAASGRTDKGVHALGQTIHFDANMNIPLCNLHLALNNILPDDIRVKKAEIVPDDFHARFSIKQKTYIYKFYVDKIKSPTRAYTHSQLSPPIDIKLMKEACLDIIGTHDFKSLSASGGSIKKTIRTVYEAEIKELNDEIIFSITANGFLYNMVRIIAGTLAYIGKEKLPKDAFLKLFETGDIKYRGKTYPPEGLYLAKVYYK